MIVPTRRNFGGQALAERVGPDAQRIHRRISGYDNSSGYLKPEYLPSRTSASKLTGTMLEQVPLVFRTAADRLRVICRDADTSLQILDAINGDWEPAGDWQVCTMATADTVTCVAHGYTTGDAVQFSGTTGGVTVGTTRLVG
jgi:hypothetical protein